MNHEDEVDSLVLYFEEDSPIEEEYSARREDKEGWFAGKLPSKSVFSFLAGALAVVVIFLIAGFFLRTSNVDSVIKLRSLENRIKQLENRSYRIDWIEAKLEQIEEKNKQFTTFMDTFMKLETPPKISTAQTSEKQTKAVYHEVVAGETLYGISRRYGLTVDELRRLNKLEPDLVTERARVSVTTKIKRPIQLPDHYKLTERDIFGSSEEKASFPQQEISLEGIPLADESVGLKLVGTAVTGNPKMNLAILDNLSARRQETYHEGEQVGRVLIKKILRNHVIINTGVRDAVLMLESKEGVNPTRTDVRLKREEIESTFTDPNEIMQQAQIRPYVRGGQVVGFQVTKMKPDSIFWKMGLRNDDVIKGMNNESIRGSKHLVEFGQKLIETGEVALKINRGGRSQELRYTIE